MSNQEQRETALRNWLIGVTGLPERNVFREVRGGAKPKNGDFITFSPLIPIGELCHNFVSDFEEVGNTEGETKTTHTSIKNIRTSVHIYSLNGVDIAEKLALSPSMFKARSALSQGDLTYRSVSPGSWIPTFLDTGPEDKFVVNFTFATQFDFEETDYELRTTTISGETIKPDDSVIPVQLTLDFT